MTLDDDWFSPTEDKYQIHWLLVETSEGMNFTEAVEHCRSKGTYVGLPSSLENLSELTTRIPVPTWLGLKKPSRVATYDTIWERFSGIFTEYNSSEFDIIESDHNCFQVRKDETDTIIKQSADCSEKVQQFMCEYYVTENEKRSEGFFSNDELSFHNQGFDYAYYRFTETWVEAKRICQERGEGWSLAEIDSLETSKLIMGAIDRDRHFWLNGRRDYISDEQGCGNPTDNPFKWQRNDSKRGLVIQAQLIFVIFNSY